MAKKSVIINRNRTLYGDYILLILTFRNLKSQNQFRYPD